MLLIFFSMIIARLLLNFLQQKLWKSVGKQNFYDLLHDMPMAPTAGGTTAQSGQWNDDVTAPKTQRLHQRLGYINRTLHANIEKPASLEKNINNSQKLNFYVFMKTIINFVEKICIWLLAQHSTVIHNKQYTTQQTIHNTKYIVVI